MVTPMSTGMKLLAGFTCLIAAVSAAGCASSNKQAAGPPLGAMMAANTAVEPKVPANYVIQPGDVLLIKFEFHPDHDQTVTVRTDGGITLPLAGEVKAAGLMPEQLADELTRLYSKNLRDPRISVGLKVTSLSRVYVGGEVNKPGFVFYRPGLTAVQAVVGAGGPKFTGAMDKVVLVRMIDETRYQATVIDLAKAVEKGDTTDSLALGPNDVLYVPKTGIAKANVWNTQWVINMNPFRGFFTIPFYP